MDVPLAEHLLLLIYGHHSLSIEIILTRDAQQNTKRKSPNVHVYVMQCGMFAKDTLLAKNFGLFQFRTKIVSEIFKRPKFLQYSTKL